MPGQRPPSHPVPPTLKKNQLSKLRTALRKVGEDRTHLELLRSEIPDAHWGDALRWVMVSLGAEINRHFQVIGGIALQNVSLQVEDGEWLLATLEEELRCCGKRWEHTAMAIRSWPWSLDWVVQRSFLAAPDRLRRATVRESYRTGVCYALGHLGAELTSEERDSVLKELARSWVVKMDGFRVTLRGSDGELVCHDDAYQIPGAEGGWGPIYRPFGSDDDWGRAVCATVAEIERHQPRFCQTTTYLDRVLPFARLGRRNDLAVALAYSYTDDTDRLAALAAEHLGPLDTSAKAALRNELVAVGDQTRRNPPEEVLAALGG